MARPRLLTSADVLMELRAAFKVRGGFAPTVQQLRDRLGQGGHNTSTRTVRRYLAELEQAGKITRDPVRGLRLTRGRSRCPRCGR